MCCETLDVLGRGCDNESIKYKQKSHRESLKMTAKEDPGRVLCRERKDGYGSGVRERGGGGLAKVRGRPEPRIIGGQHRAEPLRSREKPWVLLPFCSFSYAKMKKWQSVVAKTAA